MAEKLYEVEELLSLLTGGDLEEEYLLESAAYVSNAPNNPELEWAGDDSGMMTFAIIDTLAEWVASSDKVDELHQQIEEFFTDPIPKFPYDDEDIRNNSFAYFRWLDQVLAGRAPEKGGYELVSVNPGLDDNLYVMVVDRVKTDRILALANLLDVMIYRENGAE